MDFYQLSLGLLVAANAGLLWTQYRRKDGSSDQSVNQKSWLSSAASTRNFQLTFYIPYTIAVAVDWLQGPHIYAIYKYEKNLPEKIVAALYATGFAAGAVSASFAGSYADRFGRKKACLLYCGLYFLTCLSMLSENLTILFLGRVAGGVSTTLLFSVFEAWMISDYHERGLGTPVSSPILTAYKEKAEVQIEEAEYASSSDDGSGPALPLDSVFSTMATLSCVVAIVAGVFGDMLVSVSGTRTWPFLAAMLCSVAAAGIISSTWRENYGSISSTDKNDGLLQCSESRFDFLRDPKILALGLATCVFEGTMYLFIFFWSAALKNARDTAFDNQVSGELPFGLIFSSFMCAMLAGSAVFSHLRGANSSNSDILLSVIVIVSGCLGIVVNVRDERVLFLAFCMIEGCIGVYNPAMASLKSQIVDDDIRGRVYSVLRAPLNIFVVVAHCLDEEGSRHRNNVFLACAGLLLIAYCVAQRHFPK